MSCKYSLIWTFWEHWGVNNFVLTEQLKKLGHKEARWCVRSSCSWPQNLLIFITSSFCLPNTVLCSNERTQLKTLCKLWKDMLIIIVTISIYLAGLIGPPSNYLYLLLKAITTYFPFIYTSTLAKELLISGSGAEAHDQETMQSKQANDPCHRDWCSTRHRASHGHEYCLCDIMMWTWSYYRSPLAAHEHTVKMNLQSILWISR